MPTVGPCALQRAYLELRNRGDEDGILALTELVNDHDTSTRAAAATARDQLDVIVSHNNFTTHRTGTCGACNRVLADGQDPTKVKIKKGSHAAPQFGKAKPYTDAQRAAASAAASKIKASMRQDEDGNVILKDVPLYKPLQLDDDLSPLLTQFGLAPDRFEVIKDSFSMWMQSASDGAGGRDVTYLYSAKFRRVGQVDPGLSNAQAISDWHSILIKKSKPSKPRYKKSAGTPGTYALWPSDLQLGKPGTAEAVHNFTSGITQGLEECQRLIDTGVPIEGLHIGWGGDETEGVANSYANQSYLIELNLSQQLELDTELRIWAIEQALEMGLPLSTSHVVSNHGESFTRNGSKDPVTTKYDNASTHIARQVKRVFDKSGHRHIKWTIADEDAGVILNLSGEKVYASHGHIEKGRGGSTELRTKNAIEKQILGDIGADQRLLNIRLYVMAHYHHYYMLEDQGRVIIGLPALEAEKSSGWIREAHGVWSPPGLAAMVVGPFQQRPFKHLNVFGSSPAAGLILPDTVVDFVPNVA